MFLSNDAKLIYSFLCNQCPNKKVVTYGTVSKNTNVPLGEGGGAVRDALAEIFKKSDAAKLPPITSIVVQEANLYDRKMRYGMPGGGYLSAEAQSPNFANRPRQAGIERWADKPRPKDTEVWAFQKMIEQHQDLVWDYQGAWPSAL